MAMKKTCKLFTVLGKLNVEVLSFNTDFVSTPKDVVGIHGLILSNFVESDFDDLIEFFKDSVENDYYLNDMLEEIYFEVNKEATEIILEKDDEKITYQNMGEYTVGDYRVFISGSYSFIVDLYDNKRKYMYYGD